MTTIDDAPALFDVPAPVAPPSRPRGKHPPSPEPDEGASGATGQPRFDPSRWVMVGWRSGSWKAGPPLTREQIAAVINTPRGPCAGCGMAHHRYGPGGQPLCPACRNPHASPSKKGP